MTRVMIMQDRLERECMNHFDRILKTYICTCSYVSIHRDLPYVSVCVCARVCVCVRVRVRVCVLFHPRSRHQERFTDSISVHVSIPSGGQVINQHGGVP